MVLNQVLSAALFPNEFPYFGRFRVPRSQVGDVLLRGAAPMYDLVMHDWTTLVPLRAKGERGLGWARSMRNKDFYQYFTFFDSGLDDPFFEHLGAVLAEEMPLRPDRVVLLTDGMCGSSCA